jgi:hypothetical protein
MRKSLAMMWLAIVGIMLIGGAAGCAVINQLKPLALQTQIDKAEQQWQAQHIGKYRIEVQHVQSIWHLQINTITVEDGKVVAQSATCQPAPFEGRECKVKPFNAKDYTVAGLFAQARSVAKSERGGVTITFDQTYGFPKLIISAPPRLVDADSSWEVLSFEVLD